MIETSRLTLYPLTYDQLVKYQRNDLSLEAELQLLPTPRTVSEALREALEQTILPNVAANANDYLFHTLWTAIRKADRQLVGDLCIVGIPNAAGEIEIGYGTYPAFCKQGLMTEMVGGILQWAASQPAVKAVVASTDKDNTASFAVLRKNQFKQVNETATLFHWRRAVKG
ncbi:MAG: N-acetyltransferase [Bacteroidetes bacterium]|nr:MAG: N-acetyltransferase [Bacteroidota bacterium]PTM10954.1 MAG: N-acetyltransferase [Bacteroidota bacterium]